jgi:hypothetical protein
MNEQLTDDESHPHRVALRSVRSVTEETFGSVPPLQQPMDTRELRAMAIEDIAENAAAEDQGRLSPLSEIDNHEGRVWQ